MLDVKPVEYFATGIKREKRDCKSCEERGVSTAAVPERIAPMSLLSDRLVAGIVVAKYSDYVGFAVMWRCGGVGTWIQYLSILKTTQRSCGEI